MHRSLCTMQEEKPAKWCHGCGAGPPAPPARSHPAHGDTPGWQQGPSWASLGCRRHLVFTQTGLPSSHVREQQEHMRRAARRLSDRCWLPGSSAKRWQRSSRTAGACQGHKAEVQSQPSFLRTSRGEDCLEDAPALGVASRLMGKHALYLPAI